MRTMKDSGIEWIGQIPESWSVEALKRNVKIEMGQSPASECYNSDGVGFPFLQGNADFTDKFPVERMYTSAANKFSKTGDLLLSVRAPVGAVNIADKEYAIGRGLCAITGGRISIPFLWYAIAVLNHEFDANSTGSTFESINTEDVGNAKIMVPGEDEQRRITEYLDVKCTEIDALIAAKEKTNALLKERRQSIIYEAVTKGLNPDAPMKDSGVEWIGEIPEHWDVVALKRVATPSTGMTPSKLNPQYWEGDIPWFSSKDIKSDYLFDSEDHISHQAVEECGLTVHDENSVVFCARSGILRHTFPVSVLNCKGTINQDLRVLATSALIDPEYLMYYLRGMNNTIVTLYQKVGATVESIEMEWLLYLPVALPSIDEQKRIAEYVVAHCNEIDRQITANEVSVTKLKEYRQSIIYEAVTGKIEV